MQKDPPKTMAATILRRSDHYVFQIGAVLVDPQGRCVSWGWNTYNQGTGWLSGHAEVQAVRRANRKRLRGSSVYVAGMSRKSGQPVLAKPCKACAKLLAHFGIRMAYFTTKKGWESVVWG